MTHVMKLIDDALVETLIGNPPLNQMAGRRVYNQIAPPGTPIPYVVFSLISGGFTNTSPRDDTNLLYQVIGWSTSAEQAYKLGEYIHQALHRHLLALDGWSNYRLAGQRLISLSMYVEAQQYFGIGEEFGIRTDKTG